MLKSALDFAVIQVGLVILWRKESEYITRKSETLLLMSCVSKSALKSPTRVIFYVFSLYALQKVDGSS